MKNLIKVSMTGLALIASTQAFANNNQDDNRIDHAILLIDITGSLNSHPITSDAYAELYPTRCDFMKYYVGDKVGNFAETETKNKKVLYGDFLDVRVFSGPNTLESISNGFQPIGKWYRAPAGSPDRQKYDDFVADVKAKIKNINCSGSTALGDSVCVSIDDLKSRHKSFSDRLWLTLFTDAKENASQICKGADYVDTHIRPKAKSAPLVRVTFEALTKGNADPKIATTLEFDSELMEYRTVSRGHYSTLSSSGEIDSFIQLAEETGGVASIITDDLSCQGDCNEFLEYNHEEAIDDYYGDDDNGDDEW